MPSSKVTTVESDQVRAPSRDTLAAMRDVDQVSPGANDVPKPNTAIRRLPNDRVTDRVKGVVSNGDGARPGATVHAAAHAEDRSAWSVLTIAAVVGEKEGAIVELRDGGGMLVAASWGVGTDDFLDRHTRWRSDARGNEKCGER